MEKRNVPNKNYIFLALLALGVIVGVFHLSANYRIMEDTNKKIPIIRGTLPELKIKEIDHYLIENPDTIIYMCEADNNKCRLFEKQFKEFLSDEKIENLVYLNLTDENIFEYKNTFNNKYKIKKNIKLLEPTFVIMESGKVKSILETKNNLSIKEVKSFLKHNNIGE